MSIQRILPVLDVTINASRNCCRVRLPLYGVARPSHSGEGLLPAEQDVFREGAKSQTTISQRDVEEDLLRTPSDDGVSQRGFPAIRFRCEKLEQQAGDERGGFHRIEHRCNVLHIKREAPFTVEVVAQETQCVRATEGRYHRCFTRTAIYYSEINGRVWENFLGPRGPAETEGAAFSGIQSHAGVGQEVLRCQLTA
ncbi:hypothetical protein Tsp_06670 [Trichinella spiralis]|uniref:hypothetical protein n=1 Tax=Trichinella spiralis TaxID=6334 RepID=UPI0001EFB53E|nr:hypothetical protein Tsp_06670 [Trichinella spiralis]